ncbi:hypothetical protein [Paraburkholderia sp.]|uniref:hypothetical protein n=1 Tax=Paraburkholderia sp. TaxID=1926495 RepID=UPI0039E6B267
MQVFLAGTNVQCVIPLADRSGAPLNAQSVRYRIVDQANAELQPLTPLDDFVAGAADVQITVPASLNALGATPTEHTIPTREGRIVELYLTLSDGNETSQTFIYAIEPVDVLVTGLNSFQSYAQAQITAIDIPNTPAWDCATDEDRYAAMIEARWHLCKLSYYLLNCNLNFGQDSLNFVPEGVYQSKYVATDSLFMFDGNLELLNADQFNALPERFKGALRKAQVAEADAILSQDVVASKREQGITSDAVGTTRQTFRSTKPLDMPCSKRAMSYLSYFLTNSKRLART